MEVTRPEDLMELAIKDPKQIIETCFWVVGKDTERVPFIFNDLQNEFYYQRTKRDDILKAGQIGFSTMILAILTVKFLLVPRTWGVSLSYEAEATTRLFSKVEFWLEPKNLHPILQPFLKLSTDRTGTKINERMESRLYVGTAGARAFGRGDTIHYAHMSETSRWKDAGRIATGIIRAVPLPDKPIDTWIVGETTADGIGNYHHTEWVREIEGQSRFKPYFALWLKHNEYEIKGEPITDYTNEERNIRQLYPDLATDDKLRWRREMIRNLKSEDGRSPEDMFRQEFPTTWQEAFLYSGSPVFNQETLNRMMSAKKEPIKIGNLVGLNPQPTLDINKKGDTKIYEEPAHGEQYIIFGDVGDTHDRCVDTVLNKRTAQVVAKYKAVINARTFGKEIQKLGYYYNQAMIAIEINNMGQSSMDQCIEDNYPNIYFRQRLDKITKETTEVPGWRTTEQSKAQMIGHMQNLIQEGLMLYDEDIIGEMMTFVRNKNGKMEAVQGAFDDCVISVCGAYYILRLHPYTPPATPRTRNSYPGQRLKNMRSAARK
jgi:hypothetical protein